MNAYEVLRMLCGVIVSPAVPIVGLSFMYYDRLWMPMLALYGYLFFCLFGIPALGFIKRKKLLPLTIAGGVVCTLPLLLVSALVFFRNMSSLGEMLKLYSTFFAFGAIGGGVFWTLVYWATSRDVPEEKRLSSP